MNILVGDFGGTNPRLAMMNAKDLSILLTTKVDQHGKDIISQINEFLTICAQKGFTTDTASIGIAGPVNNNACLEPTNFTLPVDGQQIVQMTALQNVHIFNDFEVLGHAVANLQTDDSRLFSIRSENTLTGNKAIVGPGTGVGVGYIYQDEHRYVVGNSEGGHSGIFIPPHHIDILSGFQKELRTQQISAESVISGPGIVRLFKLIESNYDEKLRVLSLSWHGPQNTGLTQELETSLQNKEVSGLTISQNSLKHPWCYATMHIFFELLGYFCQSVVLHANAQGGLFIGGGIVANNLQLLQESRFLETFTNNYKHNIQQKLSQVSVHVITDYDLSFEGAVRAVNKR